MISTSTGTPILPKPRLNVAVVMVRLDMGDLGTRKEN
jgi:hypothetical protein